MNDDLLFSVILSIVFVFGLLSKMYGRATLLLVAIFIADCIVSTSTDVSGFLTVIFFTFLSVKHLKKYGKNSPLYKYNPYATDGKMPMVLRLVLFVMSLLAIAVSVLARFFKW
ncbi:MAG: hypothetical protein ILM98_06495 [Kiritimatiellae bacterium]|nr:hypothetical protein [Kiritimatiellia bacterium]